MNVEKESLEHGVEKLAKSREAGTRDFYYFICCYADTLPALQVQQERTQVLCSNRKAQKRPARGHSRNGPWTQRHRYTYIDTKKRNKTKHTSIDTQHE